LKGKNEKFSPPKTNYKRGNDRRDVSMRAELVSEDGVIPCSVLNLSTGGSKIEIAQILEQDQRVEINIGNTGKINSRVAWSNTPYHGLQFEGNAEEMAEKLMAIAMYGKKD